MADTSCNVTFSSYRPHYTTTRPLYIVSKPMVAAHTLVATSHPGVNIEKLYFLRHWRC
jgi:hypothetical protein